MPPPVTPSPHRFLPPSSAKGQAHPLPPSSLRKQQPPSSQQFRPTPRFTAQSGGSNHVETIDSPGPSPLVTQGHATQRQPAHDAEDHLSGHGRPEDESRPPGAQPSDDEMLLDASIPPKRKRHSPSPSRSARPGPGEPHDLIVLSSSPAAERSPSASPMATRARYDAPLERPREVPPPRFRLPLPGDKAPETPAAPRIGDPAAPLLKTSRPGFVLPPRDDAPAILPEVFSPHKKGSKVFEPGGMADAVRGWILALESTHSRNVLEQTTKRRKPRQEKGHKIVVQHVTDTRTGVWTVHAPGEERWILIGSQGLGGSDARRVQEKSTILLKPPTWHVSLHGERWGVAIAWSVIDSG